MRLLPGLDPESPLYTIEPIYNYSPAELRRTAARLGGSVAAEEASQEDAARKSAAAYGTIPAVPPCGFTPQTIAASTLHVRESKTPQGEFDFAAGGSSADGSTAAGSSAASGDLDKLLEAAGLGPGEFGSIVHGFIEDRFNGRPPGIPRRLAGTEEARITEAAQAMTETFFASPLGRKAAAASFRKTEYPVLTTVKQGRERIIVSGAIDLLFEEDGRIYVVDFKTDRDEDTGRHTGQLAVYKQAVEDIFEKPVLLRLFYLRNGREADMDAEVKRTSLEELVRSHVNAERPG